MTSATDMTGGPASRSGRLAVIDIARGVAILAMIIYHLFWDLGFLQFIALDVTTDPGWIAFQRLIVGSFIFLTGVSLVLAHGEAIRWPAFRRRFAVIGGAALLVSAGTYAFSPSTFVYFGVLHAIAAFSLAGLAFLRAPLWLVLAIAALILLLPLAVSSPILGEKLWSWIGMWDVPPPSEDLVPVFPWFGVVLLGIALARIARDRRVLEKLSLIRADNFVARALTLAGRWSLVIYLVHQPILLGGLFALAEITQTGEAMRVERFVQSCESSCVETGSSAAYCTAYCACGLNRVATEDLWQALEAPQRTAEEDAAIIGLTSQCAAETFEQFQAK